MIDAHSHIGDEAFDSDRSALLERAVAAGLTGIVCVGQDTATAQRALQIKRKGHPSLQFAATAGLHPHEASRAHDEWPQLQQLAADTSIDALGETGLDFYYNHSPRDAQRRSFRAHLELARSLAKPVVVHIRDAHPEALDDLRSVPGVKAMIHCFTGTAAEAASYLELDCYISFSGIITFKTADAIREAARTVPRERLLVETDAPFLAPIPHRGRRCEPAFVADTLRVLAKTRGDRYEDVLEATTANARSLFFR
jgi:TatD DNase family protein